MILSGHQPVYLPGIVVMAKIALSDKFMFVGHCDYQPKSWQSHNFVRGYKEPIMLSVPVVKGISINETKPISGDHWRRKHLKTMELNYHKRDYFKDYYPEIEHTLMQPVGSLSELNINLIRVLMHMLHIDTPTYLSEDYDIPGHKTAMLVDMCKKMECNHYLSSPGETYVKPEEMNGHTHSFLKFTHPPYEQGYRTFMPNLSVIDLLFNCGPEAATIIRGMRQPMSSWADELIANQLGYPYCVLFPRARDAIYAWTKITGSVLNLPSNICPVARDWAYMDQYRLYDIDETGMAPGITTQLYGYREEGDGTSEMDLDPLGTGFFARPCATSAIVSFGDKKFITVGGAAFATKDQGLAQAMEERGYFPPALVDYLKLHLNSLFLACMRDKRRDRLHLWDRYLGDTLQRINREQIIPWRVMRLVPMGQREKIVRQLRGEGFDVGTNYPALPGHGLAGNMFGDKVLNLFLSEDYDEKRIERTCNNIKWALKS